MLALLWQTVRLSVKSLSVHVLRSVLAIVGVAIGVWAVITLVAGGEGVSYQAQKQIEQLGAKNIIVRSIKPPAEGTRSTNSAIVSYGLLRDDYARIVETVPTVRRAVPLREIRKEARYHDRSLDIRLVGCTADYLEMNKLEMFRGRFLTDRDGDGADNVAVLAYETAKELFPYENPVGKSVQIDRDFYRVVGQTARREATGGIGGSFSGQDFSQDIYIPLDTLRTRIGDKVLSFRSGSFEGELVELSQITVTVGEMAEVDQTANLIRRLLERFHRDKIDYSIVVPKELLRQAELTRRVMNALMVFIACISLTVGGIGIMNIMLATVTERTREIGIRRALGAKQRNIIHQFLTETVVLSATGGLVGMLVGLFTAGPGFAFGKPRLERLLPDMFTAMPMLRDLEPRVAPWSVAASLLISVGVGIVAGLYPAWRAAQMDPIEALRHE